MTDNQKIHIMRISDLASAIWTVARSGGTTETESVKTLAELVSEEIEKIETEEEAR